YRASALRTGFYEPQPYAGILPYLTREDSRLSGGPPLRHRDGLASNRHYPCHPAAESTAGDPAATNAATTAAAVSVTSPARVRRIPVACRTAWPRATAGTSHRSNRSLPPAPAPAGTWARPTPAPERAAPSRRVHRATRRVCRARPAAEPAGATSSHGAPGSPVAPWSPARGAPRPGPHRSPACAESDHRAPGVRTGSDRRQPAGAAPT